METPQSTPSLDFSIENDYQIESVALIDHAIQIRWNDGIDSTYHYIWLRDNCPSAFHPHTGERSFEVSQKISIHSLSLLMRQR